MTKAIHCEENKIYMVWQTYLFALHAKVYTRWHPVPTFLFLFFFRAIAPNLKYLSSEISDSNNRNNAGLSINSLTVFPLVYLLSITPKHWEREKWLPCWVKSDVRNPLLNFNTNQTPWLQSSCWPTLHSVGLRADWFWKASETPVSQQENKEAEVDPWFHAIISVYLPQCPVWSRIYTKCIFNAAKSESNH